MMLIALVAMIANAATSQTFVIFARSVSLCSAAIFVDRR